jgi:release factor glutamine methyltransferase
MLSSTKQVFFEGSTFVVSKHVYEPAEDSFLFAENLDVKQGATVLDVGAGCGLLGILVAKKASTVVAIDINPYAILCTKENARLNNVQDKMFFVRGDLVAPLSRETDFDVILFNAPYLPSDSGEPASWLDRAWDGGVAGRQVIDRFINTVTEHLKKGGQILLMQSTLADVNETIRNFKKHNLTAAILAQRDQPFFETLLLIKAQWRQ